MVTRREKEEKTGKKRKEREVREQNRGEIKKTESYWLEDNSIIEEKDKNKKVDCYEKMDIGICISS